MTELDNRAIELVRNVAAWLVEGNFLAIENRSGGVRLTADMIRQAVAEYKKHLIMPPNQAFTCLDAIRVTNSNCPTWSVRLDLWTAEEGRSDLTIELTISDQHKEVLTLEVDNIHTL
jgi:hypothetical protein